MGRLYMLAGNTRAEMRRKAARELRSIEGVGVIDLAEIGLNDPARLSALLFACDGLVLVGTFLDDEICMECIRLASRLSLEIKAGGEILRGQSPAALNDRTK